MKQRLKTVFCLLLLAVFLVPSVQTAFAYTTQEVVNAALTLIYTNEGVYTTVLANDNGAVSIGKVGWHGTRALNLLKTIVSADVDGAVSLLGKELTDEILQAADWSTRTFSVSEQNAVSQLLATQAGKTAQDALAYKDIQSYIVHGKSIGITDGKALVYFADLENQMGANGSERVALAAVSAVGSAAGVTLSALYQAAMNDSVAASSPTRRKTSYEYCNALSFGGGSPAASSLPTGTYTVTASSLRFRSGPGTSYDVIASPLPNGTVVTVTQISGDWGKITYNGQTGWISLLYAVYSGASGSSVKGDIDGNGLVELTDARRVLRYASSLEKLNSAQLSRADVNADGKVNAADARLILRAAIGIQVLS